MGLFSAVFGLPLAPVRGVVWIGEVVRRQVEEETTSPAAMRRDLEAIEEGRRSGRISEDDATRAEDEILHRVTRRKDVGTSPEEE
jgi:hypothetical protein